MRARRGLVLAALAVLLLAALAALLLAARPRPAPPADLARSFADAVSLLNRRQYGAAAVEWHKVLRLAPQLPEAHVNMGFTMIGLARYAVARDFFGVALELNKNQNNAYFGLALALDGLGDRAGALGAMRTYVHRSRGADPYRRRAEAAIWEWQAAQAGAAAIPENGNRGPRTPIAGNTAD